MLAGVRPRGRPRQRPRRTALEPAHADRGLRRGRRAARRRASRHHPELGLARSASSTTTRTAARRAARGSARSTRSRAWSLPGRVDRVMVAFSRAHHEELLDVLRTCRDAGIAVDVVPRLFEFLDGARTMDQIGGLPLLSIDVPRVLAALARRQARAGHRRRERPAARARAAADRGRDRDQARLDGARPVPAAALGSRRPYFTLLKFRSMRRRRDRQVRDGRRDRQGPPRRARDARRPLHPALLARRGAAADQRAQRRHEPRRPAPARDGRGRRAQRTTGRSDAPTCGPGLTGPWQISGRSNIPFHEMIQLRLPVRGGLVARPRPRDPDGHRAGRDLGPRRLLGLRAGRPAHPRAAGPRRRPGHPRRGTGDGQARAARGHHGARGDATPQQRWRPSRR